MKTNNTYYSKIKLFIIFLAAVSQAFLVITVAATYINSKVSTFRTLVEHQNTFYHDELDTLCVKIDNLLYVLETSGTLKFCSNNSVFLPEDEKQRSFETIKNNLSNSVLANRYFSGYYSIGKNKNQISFSKLGDDFSDIDEFTLHYDKFINDYAVNAFTQNYQKLFLFNKEEFADVKIDSTIENDYNEMLDTLDGKIVYFTLEQDVFCVFIINPEFLETVFSDAGITDTSIAILNSSGDIIYTKDSSDYSLTSANLSDSKHHTYSADMYTLITASGLRFTPADAGFICGIILCCAVIILWAVRISKIYADKIIEPYRIFKGFFGLNYKAEDIDSIDYLDSDKLGQPNKKRSDISKNFLKALVLAIIIPTVISATAYMTVLNLLSDNFLKNQSDSAHMHLVQKLYDTFDFYLTSAGLYDNPNHTEQPSRLRYSVTLDENFSLDIPQFDKLNYISSSVFNRQLKQLKEASTDNGTLMYINSDLFGDNALASVYKSADNTYTLTVFKYETLGSIVPDSDTGFMLLDPNNDIVSQNLYITENEKNRIITGDRSKFVHKTYFPDFNWTLYSFSDVASVKSNIHFTIYMDMAAILVFLLFLIIFSWLYSTKFMTPLERIETAMSKDIGTEDENGLSGRETNEIEEVLHVYNKMVTHIKKLTNDKVCLVRKEEQVNSLKIKAELNALQQQINPHFLYNTFEMINLSVLKTGDISTSKVIGKLSKIFRYSISSVAETVCLYDEIENTRNYMSIWDTRFPGRYKFIWNMDESLMDIKVLKLIMQPIMENCFFHAFNDIMENCIIEVNLYMEDNSLFIIITDNGCGMSQADINALYQKFSVDVPEHGNKGIGIWNVYKRLKLYYGDNADLTVSQNTDAGTAIQIRINF